MSEAPEVTQARSRVESVVIRADARLFRQDPQGGPAEVVKSAVAFLREVGAFKGDIDCTVDSLPRQTIVDGGSENDVFRVRLMCALPEE